MLKEVIAGEVKTVSNRGSKGYNVRFLVGDTLTSEDPFHKYMGGKVKVGPQKEKADWDARDNTR